MDQSTKDIAWICDSVLLMLDDLEKMIINKKIVIKSAHPRPKEGGGGVLINPDDLDQIIAEDLVISGRRRVYSVEQHLDGMKVLDILSGRNFLVKVEEVVRKQ